MQLQVGHAQVGAVERAHDRDEVLAALQAHGGRARRARGRREPNWLSTSATASRSARSTGVASTDGRPISAFSDSGVPSATMCPASMIPTRSASTSASSRYWVVRKTVTPSSRASRATSAHRSARYDGSSPVVGSSRNRTRGECTSASARSSRRFMPPE